MIPSTLNTAANSRRQSEIVRPRFLWAVAAAAMIAGARSVSAAGAEDARAEILRLDAQWLQAVQARDVERALSFWADDAVVYPPGGPAVVGKAAIREFVLKSLAAPGFTISWKTTDVVVAGGGDMAYGTVTNRVTVDGPDGKSVVLDGKGVTVWRRGKDGAWKCVVDIWNDVAPAAH